MRFLFVLVVLVLPNLGIARDPNAYCKRHVLRPKAVIKNGVETTENVKKVITICCKGYEKYSGRCVPFCEKGCSNAKCTAPNVCTCKTGYKKLHEHRCEPVCHNCKYGFCSSPGKCNCYSGYEKNATTGICEPKCDPPCVNGYCSDPNFCLCHEGYHMFKANANICMRNTSTTAEYTSTQLYSTSTVDEALYSSSSVNKEPYSTSSVDADQQTYVSHQEVEEYKYSTDIVDETTAVEETTKDIRVYSSTDTDQIQEIIRDKKDDNFINIVDQTTSQRSDKVTEENNYIKTPQYGPSDSEEIASRVGSSSESPTLAQVIKTSDTDEHPTKGDIGIFSDVTAYNDIKIVRVSQYSTESTYRRETMKGADSSIIKEEINSSSHAAIVWIPVYIASLAVFVIVSIILVAAFARKYLEGKEYNIAKLEERKGIATYFNGKENVITAW